MCLTSKVLNLKHNSNLCEQQPNFWKPSASVEVRTWHVKSCNSVSLKQKVKCAFRIKHRIYNTSSRLFVFLPCWLFSAVCQNQFPETSAATFPTTIIKNWAVWFLQQFQSWGIKSFWNFWSCLLPSHCFLRKNKNKKNKAKPKCRKLAGNFSQLLTLGKTFSSILKKPLNPASTAAI